MNKSDFKKELAGLINKYSLENRSNTPDYLLANYLMACLDNYSHIVRNRDDWYNFKPWNDTTTTKERGGL